MGKFLEPPDIFTKFIYQIAMADVRHYAIADMMFKVSQSFSVNMQTACYQMLHNTGPPVHVLSISASSQCLGADLPIYSPAYFSHFLLIQVQTCIDKYRSQFISCTYLHPPSANLPTTSTRVDQNISYSAKLSFGVLISIGVLM